MLNFAWPWMIVLLPLPLVIYKIASQNQDYKSKLVAIINFPRLQHLRKAFIGAKTSINYRAKLPVALGIIAWSCIVISLMRPELIKDHSYVNNTGYDLMLAVDLSRSMEAVDFKDNGKVISRIAATKKVVANFVKQREGDRIGLIVFADQAFLTIPLTLDTATVAKMLNNLVLGMAGESTAIGDAIGIGVQNLRKRPLASRVLIILTDGIDNSSHIPPLEAAKIAAADDIKIYTIGMGDRLDDTLLEKISSITGGTYSKVTSVADLEEVYAQIDSLEKSEASHKVVLFKTPLYQPFIVIALLCLAAFFVINSRKNRDYNVFN